MSVTPQRFSASILARKLIADGGNTCPRPCRGRKTTFCPSSVPKQNSSEVRPNGLSTRRQTISVNPSIRYRPLPPIIPMMRSVMERSPPVSCPGRRIIVSMWDARPDLALDGVEHASRDQQEQHDLEAGAVPLFEVRLRRPHQKIRDVVRHLRDR